MLIVFSPSSSQTQLKKLRKYLTGIVVMQLLYPKIRCPLQHEGWGGGLVLLIIAQHMSNTQLEVSGTKLNS